MVLRAMQGPIAGMVNVLQGNIRNFVYALEAVRKRRKKLALSKICIFLGGK